MSRFLFVVPPLSGHVNPTIARALIVSAACSISIMRAQW